MDLQVLEKFLLWCLLVNFGLYTLTVVAVMIMRDFVCRINAKLFGIEEKTVKKAVFKYIAAYKLLIIIFNFVPWLAVLIIK